MRTRPAGVAINTSERRGTSLRWDGRYAGAGLAWGALVGALTGVLVAGVLAVGSIWRDGLGGSAEVMFLVAAPVLGVLLGVVAGAACGLAAGTVTAVTAAARGGSRQAWWSALITTWVVGGAVALALPVLIFGSSYSSAGWPSGVLVAAATLGAWLMARTTRPVLADTF